MKKLLLLRHAKSDWHASYNKDFDRPLNECGERSADFMAERLQTKNIKPDIIISSPALRAYDTIKRMAKILLYPEKDIIVEEVLYRVDVVAIRQIVECINDDVDTAMLVSHNPTITAFANYLTGDNIANIPTCGIYGVEFDLDTWQAVAACTGERWFFDYPKKHKEFLSDDSL